MDLKQQQHCVFPEIVSPIFPDGPRFWVELLSSKEIVPMETLQGLFCGFSRITGTVSLERDVPVEFFKCNVSVLCASPHEISFPLHVLCRDTGTKMELSKPGQIKLKLSA